MRPIIYIIFFYAVYWSKVSLTGYLEQIYDGNGRVKWLPSPQLNAINITQTNLLNDLSKYMASCAFG